MSKPYTLSTAGYGIDAPWLQKAIEEAQRTVFDHMWTHSRADNTPRPEHVAWQGYDHSAYVQGEWDAQEAWRNRRHGPDIIHIPNDDYRAFMTRARG